MRTVHDLEQGSGLWKAHRNTPGMFNASEISIIDGTSSYVTRSEFIKQKATGIEPDYDNATLARFAAGHINEAKARPLAEIILDDDLSAMVMTDTIDGILFSVSLDGITQGYDTTFEHKSLNIKLADSLDAGVIPAEYHPQMEVGLMVSGATRCLFMASKDGDPATAKHAWYESNPALRPKIVAACQQFAIDLEAYEHVEVIPAAVATPQMALPAVFIQVNGSIALTDNLTVFGEALTAYVERINKKPETDQDFADLEATVKTLKTAEETLDAEENRALGQAASIDTMRRTVALYRAIARDNRLMIDKLVKAEKENRRNEIVLTAQKHLHAHITALEQRISVMGVIKVDSRVFEAAIKGLKSLDSMRDKVASALANAKIEASAIADTIEANRLEMEGELDWSFLFPDFTAVCTKARGDFTALLVSRIYRHNEAQAAKDAASKAAEDARVAAAVEAERKAGEARAADAIEAERLRVEGEAAAILAESERKRVAAETAIIEDQRGKTAEATHAEPQATAAPQAPAASTPPTPEQSSAVAVMIAPEVMHKIIIDSGDIVREFLNSQNIPDRERGRMRAFLMAFVQYQAESALKVAA